VKKLTVIGIIGKTQGVKSAANPDKKAIKKIENNPLLSSILKNIDENILVLISVFVLFVF